MCSHAKSSPVSVTIPTVLGFQVCLKVLTNRSFPLCRGPALKDSVAVEDERIGARPEVVYHVLHTLLLGTLAMALEG